MANVHSTGAGCKDVFHAFLVQDAAYAGALEIPALDREDRVPNKLIPFSKIMSSKDTDAWVHFYEFDAAFERLWNQPRRYLPILKRYNGIIAPDFSLYRDMPLVMQYWNIYRSRALAHWLQRQGVPVIPDLRFGDRRTYETACAGLEQQGVIAVGTHGCIRSYSEQKYFKTGLDYVINKLKPSTLVVYGAAPERIFGEYEKAGVRILQFDSAFKCSRKAAP